ncbi:MAG: hypothetical protein ACJAWV_003941 [Flammeovirgaceae bacterium]|jgi:hypothetical protein
MKSLSILFALALLVFSCNTASKEEVASDLITNQKEIETPAIIEEKVAELKNSADSLDVAIIEDEKREIEKSKRAIENKIEKAKMEEKSEPISKTKTPVEKEVIEEEVPKEVPKIEEKIIIAKPEHQIWNQLAKTYVSSAGKVNYKGLKSKLPDLVAYLLVLEKNTPTSQWSRNEKLAYWFNLYNASTVYLVATNYPVNSIKDINGGKPWDKKFIKSGSELYSLNDIENGIVRKNFNEPRLHVAFNCAAVSCPILSNEAFSPAKLNSQLNSLSKKWINDTSKNKISETEIQISQIFNWYKVDFKAGVIPFINGHSSVKANQEAQITYLEYNWKLND